MLHIQLLGGFRALLDGQETPALAKQPRRAALLAYLALERDVPRERVMALLWPEADNERGRHSLNQAIYFLRRIIGADWVELRGDRLIVAPWVTTDAQQFEHAVSTGDHADALDLYHGSLLGGASLAATAEFDMWADARRAAIDRLHRRARRQHIAALVQAERTHEALQSAEEWARLDPLEDEAHHRYIELLASAGQRGAALRQFDLYRRLLAEHDPKPLDDTVALVEQLQHGERAAIVAAETEPARIEHVVRTRQPQLQPHAHTQPRTTSRTKDRIYDLLKTRRGLRILLIGVFLTNLIESSTENWLAPKLSWVRALRTPLAGGAHWLEGGFRFTHHELTNDVAVIGYSIAYYIALPVLLALVGFALAQRASIRPFRVFALAVAIDYLISLPFFLLFPMPERWWHAPSDAIVLSDRWTPLLIELYRPISALDNSFPSFHVSLSVVLVSLSIIYRLRF